MGVVAMLNHETAAKLRQMKLSGMAESYERQMAEPSVHGLSFDERLGLMVDQEWLRRQNSKMAMLLKKAGFVDSSAAIEDIVKRGVQEPWPHRFGATSAHCESHQRTLREPPCLGSSPC